jgi:hypothetical protein
LTPTSQGDFTTSRSALFADGFSTVRIGASFQANGLVAEGAHAWGVLSGPQTLPGFSTVPMVDASDNVFVGTISGVAALSGVDGSTLWFNSTADTITTQPIISASGALFVGSSSGNIYAFESKPTTGTIVVSTNNAAAVFTISDGNNNIFSGSGISFMQSVHPGSYTISYGDIPGFITPVSDTQVLPAGGSISFIGTYIAKPTLTAYPSILSFLFQQGFVGPITPQEITITSSGIPVGASASSSVTTAFNWLSVIPSSGTVPVTFSALVNPLTLQPGIYNGSITINSVDALNAPLTIPVQLVVTPQNPPLQPRPAPGANRNHQIDLVLDSLTGFSVLLESDRPLQSSPGQLTSLITIENNWKAWYFVSIRGVRSAAQNLPSSFLLGPGGRRSFQVTFAAGDSVSFNADATIAIPPQTDQDLEMLSVYGAELLWRAFTGNSLPQDAADFAIQVSARSNKFANLAVAASQGDLIGVITAIDRITEDPLFSTQLTVFGLPIAEKVNILSKAKRLFKVMEFEVNEFIAAEKFPTDTLTVTAIQH